MPQLETGTNPPAPPAGLSSQRIDDLSTRVAAVWIWTVLFGVNGGLSYSMSQGLGLQNNPMLLNAAFRGGGGLTGPGPGLEWIALAIPVFSLSGIVASLAAWGCLYLYFSLFLLPLVLSHEPVPPDPRRRRMAASALRRTYLLTIVAAGCRLLPDLLPYLMILVPSA